MIRTADPYRDTDVIDARAPRTNQAIVGALSLIAVITGWWPILGVVGAQLAIGLAFGRRYCVPCLLYFEVIQPRIGEGPIEDSRPPRFANVVGAAFLGGSTIAYLGGLSALGLALGLVVAALALLAAITGLCVGCEMYRFAERGVSVVRAAGVAGARAVDAECPPRPPGRPPAAGVAPPLRGGPPWREGGAPGDRGGPAGGRAAPPCPPRRAGAPSRASQDPA